MVRRALVVAGLLFAAVLILVLTATRQLLALSGYAAAKERLVTGILVTGTAAEPVIYVSSSDPRIGPDLAVQSDSNSGVISRLTWNGSEWDKLDLVRGLPRSRSDHASNGMALDADRGILYVAQGNHTNKGAPSPEFGFLREYPLSGTILAVDLEQIGEDTYDLPTLDRTETPFGGRGGENQALVVAEGPVQVHASGLRNPYDILLASTGRMYTVQNGANAGWGDVPEGEGTDECTNRPRDGGFRDEDTLQLVTGPGYYGGHPNPTRGECDYLGPDERDALASFVTSTNGLAEYTASNFDGALAGELLAASFDLNVYRLELDDDGDRVTSQESLAQLGSPLDVTAQGDDDVFPGTVWVAEYSSPTSTITVLEPGDFEARSGWRTLAETGFPRQEVSYVQLDGKLYLAGGGTRHQVYDPRADSWDDLEPLPRNLDHIQGVALDGRIYYIGGLESWPGPEVSSVYVYDPEADSFTEGAPMPRPRGAGGVAAYDGKVFYAGGLHEGAAVPWFDSYDPEGDDWEELADMPRPRDHFQAVVVGDRFYAIGGRDRDIDALTSANDAFDLSTEEWVEGLAELPTPRGGYGAGEVDGEVIVAGGEVADRALGTVEAYDPGADEWRTLEPMPTPRHGIQAAVCEDAVFIAAGGAEAGGGAPTEVHEALVLDNSAACGISSAPATGSDPSFAAKPLEGASSFHPTSLQFGPDGRLYVAQQDGLIKAYTIARSGSEGYAVTDTETIDIVQSIPNHDDDGSSATDAGSFVRAIIDRVGL